MMLLDARFCGFSVPVRRGNAWGKALFFAAAMLLAVWATPASAFGGASISDPVWDWKYDAIERLMASAGNPGKAVANTRPYSRIEMARQTLSLAEHFAPGKDSGGTSLRPNWYHAVLLERLKADLAREIALLQDHAPPEAFWKAPRYLRFQGARTDIPYEIENQNGFGVNRHAARLEASFSVEAGSMAAEVRPQLLYKDASQSGAALAAGYVQYRNGNWGIEVGRDSMWWGPGRRGAVIMSNHAPAFSMLKLHTYEPADVWLLGTTRAELFVGATSRQPVSMYVQESGAQVNYVEEREPLIMGYRVDFSPVSWWELGISHVVQATNRHGEQYQPADLLQLFVPDWRKNEESFDKGLVNNHLQAADMAFTFGRDFGFVDYLKMQAMKFYVEYGGEAVYFNSKEGLWLQFPAVIYGLYFDFGGTDLRLEYGTNSDRIQWYSHYQFTGGYRNDGFVMGHRMGGFAKDLTVDAGFAVNGADKVGLHYEMLDYFMVPATVKGGGLDYERVFDNRSRLAVSCQYFGYSGGAYNGGSNAVVAFDYLFNF